MKSLSKAVFTELASFRSIPAISIFIPTHDSGVEVNELQDAIFFKSILQDIRKKAEGNGLKRDETEKALHPGFELLEDEDFWRNQQQGLAVFMVQDFFKTMRLPVPVSKEVVTGSRFYVLPLLPLMNPKPFFLLVLSKGDAKFYRGNRFELEEMHVKGLPNGMDDVIHFEEKGGQQTFRRAGNKGKAAFHGHGSGLADENEYIARYLKEVDQTLMSEVLATEKAPLVLAAVDYMASQYKQVSRYHHITEASLIGNYEYENTNSLFEKAKALLEPYFSEEAGKALENYYNHSSTSLSTADPREVFPACFYGKVTDLFIEKDAHIRGSFNKETGQTEIFPDQQENADCLINQAAVQAFLNNGNTHILRKEEMPEGSKIAAFMRYK